MNKKMIIHRNLIPIEPRVPNANPWAYTYLVTGEPKIGKTTFAVEGCRALVLQCDRPQTSLAISEVWIDSWSTLKRAVRELEDGAITAFDRIVWDGVGDAYALCERAGCNHFGIEHPSDEGYARCWHWIRDNFSNLVKSLNRLRDSRGIGLVLIAHAEWKERKDVRGRKTEVLVPMLGGQCAKIINGKVDASLSYDWVGSKRVLTIIGSDLVSAGHSIDGHFLTPNGERVREISMGNSPTEAAKNFIAAFENRQTFVTVVDDSRSAVVVKKRVVRKPLTGV